MNLDTILLELQEAMNKLKIKIIYLQTENKELKKTIIKLKKYVKDLN